MQKQISLDANSDFARFFERSYVNIPRNDCPSGKTMLAYHTKILPERDRDAIENHFKECTFCSAEKIMAKYVLPDHMKYLKPDENFLKQLNDRISKSIVTKAINVAKSQVLSL